MFTEEFMGQELDQAMNGIIDRSMEMAAELDQFDEHEAVMRMVAAILKTDTPRLAVALQASMMTIRWHRTRQAEAMVNNTPNSPARDR